MDRQLLFGELFFATNVWAINHFERTAWLMFLKVKEIAILSEEGDWVGKVIIWRATLGTFAQL